MKKNVLTIKNTHQAREVDLGLSKIKYHQILDFERTFERFDFADEWNNLGYGRVTTNGTQSSISEYNLSPEGFDEILASFHLSNGELGVFAGIKDSNLIFNRELGPIDGIDFYVIEQFLNSDTAVLLDIPFNYKAAVTMRIDCDEAIASGSRLAKLYEEHSIPFSMAITTQNEFTPEAIALVQNVMKSGGSIVGHSHTHRPNWGGSKEEAIWEADKARDRLKGILPSDYNFDFVVSPFHQNPKYAVEGLRDAGIKGFVGGIIKNDPEYLVSRASWAKEVPGIMTHSQQCMLHGDCYRNAGNSLDIYKQSFENHYKSNTFFGYLDHPFSSYQYGWHSEEERLAAHEEFILFMKKFDGIWFANLVDAMSFLWIKVNTKIWVEDDKLNWEIPAHNYKNLPDLCVLWKGEKHRIPIYR